MLWNAYTRILDGNHLAAIFNGLDRQGDIATIGGKFHGIGQQVQNDLTNGAFISPELG